MKVRRSALGFLLVLGVFSFVSCRGSGEHPTELLAAPPVHTVPSHPATTSTPTPMGTPAPTDTEVPTDTPAPTSTSTPTDTPVPTSEPTLDVVRAEITLSHFEMLASSVVGDVVSATVFMGGPDVIPDHMRYLFEGYVLAETFHQPQIRVYSVSEFEAGSEVGAGVIAALEQFLADKPEAQMSIPFLPIWNAAQMMRTQVAYVSFRSGTGVRFLTQYGQDAWPINNQDLFYTFQGITNDGETYVAAILPVSHPTLPDVAPEGLDDAFYESFRSYIRDTEQELNARKASTFTPDLSLMDGMIQSIEVIRSLPEQAELYAGWASYVNADYGFSFRYPSGWSLEEEANRLTLTQGTLELSIGYRWWGEGSDIRGIAGLPTGEMIDEGLVPFLDHFLRKEALVHEEKVKALFYGSTAAMLDRVPMGPEFAIGLEDHSADFLAIDIPESVRVEIGRILGSFDYLLPL